MAYILPALNESTIRSQLGNVELYSSVFIGSSGHHRQRASLNNIGGLRFGSHI